MRRTLVLLTVIRSLSFSQTTVNPDISVLGDLLLINNSESTSLSTSGLEIAVQGYVNPFARADVYLHKHEGESVVELEEAFLTIERGLPLHLGLRTGKFRPSFGKINRDHSHTYYYILPSRPAQSLLGSEMWSSTGIEASILAPLPWYSNFSLSYMQAGIHDRDDDSKKSVNKEAEIPSAAALRFSNFFEINSITHLETGVNHYFTVSEKSEVISGVDLKFKWRPDKYRSFTIQGELMQKSGEEIHTEKKYHDEHKSGDDDIHETIVAYGWLNMQFNKVWDGGLIVDYSNDLDEAEYKSVGLFVGFSPVEESSVFRIRLHQEYHDKKPAFSIVGQIIWSLGPHKPHRF